MWKNLFFNDTSILSVTKLHCGTKGEARAFFKARLIRSVWLFCSKEKRYYPWKCLTLGIFMLLLFVYIWHFLQKFMTLCCGYMAVLVPTYFGFVFRSQRYLTQAVFLERRLCFYAFLGGCIFKQSDFLASAN